MSKDKFLEPNLPVMGLRTAGKSFVKLGLEMYGTVAIWGFNSPEWMLSSLM